MYLFLNYMTNRSAEYTQRITAYSNEKQILEKKQKHLPMLRLALFLLFALLVYKYITLQTTWMGGLAISSLTALLYLSLRDSKLKKQIRKVEILIRLNRMEIEALGSNYSAFDPGNEFVDQSHDYTHDLDIFGEGSLFQYINRTASIFGKLRLADYFSNTYGYSEDVIPRQQAIKELSGMVELRQKLRLIFHNEQIALSDKTEMAEWLGGESPVSNLKLLRVLAYGLPAVTITGIILSLAGLIAFPSLLIVAQWAIVALYAKQTLKVQSIITSKSKILNTYAQCLGLIENTVFTSAYLKDLQVRLSAKEELSPSKSIHRLSVILNYMDQNLNLLVSIFMNGLFMFNLHLLLKAEKWRTENLANVPMWFDAIASVDALSSLANFAYNHPEYIFPEKVEGEFSFQGENLGHPLIPAVNRVVNNLEIDSWNQFFIITGANMSGKSTFLRTLGVNYILAMAGAPVCASKLSFYPIQIHSSIRTSDSLTRSESYFYAELKRLKQIIDELESGKQRLILLDEILKGTNSKDKQSGSIALIEQLLRYRSVGMFCTHDLALGELADLYPGNVKNLCFEIHILGDQMVIDYKLHKGVCNNLNATYLMKNMGILFEGLRVRD